MGDGIDYCDWCFAKCLNTCCGESSTFADKVKGSFMGIFFAITACGRYCIVDLVTVVVEVIMTGYKFCEWL